MKIIGITGGVACGKTTVSDQIQNQGHIVIDADDIVASLYAKPSVRKQIENHFQTSNKQEIRQIIFSNQQAKQILEDLLHPLVKKEIQRAINKHKAAGLSMLFVAVPLLYETGLETMFDIVIAVISKEDVQKKRLMTRDGISAELAQNMIHAQMPNDEKAPRADHTIINNGSKNALLNKVTRLLTNLM